MNWLLLALLAPAVYAIVNFIDKYILEGEVEDWRSLPTYSSIMAVVFGIFLWVITGFPLLGIKDAVLVMFTGMLTIWGAVFYFKALSNNETSKIIILFQLGPLITLFLSFVFLKEMISSLQLLGFFLILFATLTISVDKKQSKYKFSAVFILILLADLLWALSYVVFKYVSNSASFAKIISFESWGFALGGFVLYFLFPSFRKAFVKTQKKVRKVALVLILLNEGIFLVAKLLTFLAISLGPVALVNVVGGTQVFFGIFYGFVLTKLVPKIFQENINKEGVAKKIIMAILTLAGLFFMRDSIFF